MDPSARYRGEALAAHLEAHQDGLTIDADAHATDVAALTGARLKRYRSTPGYYHGRPVSAEDLLREMKMSGVDMALIWQNPAATEYTEDPLRNAEALEAANRYIHDSACRYPLQFIPAGWLDPQACGMRKTLDMAEQFVEEFGFLILKMNPAQNHYPIDSPMVLQVVDRIVELGAIPAFHFGADTPFTPADGLERVALRHPEHPLLAIHMGGGGAAYEAAENLCQAARKLGLERPNIHFVFSAKRDTHIESDLIAYQLAGEPFRRHLFCGSDAPYGRMAWNFGGFRAMFDSLIDGPNHTDERVRNHPGLFTREAARDYLGGNFARFVIQGYRRLLSARGVSAG